MRFNRTTYTVLNRIFTTLCLPENNTEEIRARLKDWALNMRIGRYQQDRKFLRSPKGHCCLGIMCDMVDPTRWVQSENPTETPWVYEEGFKGSNVHHRSYPPMDVTALFGVTALADEFAALNDDYDCTFFEIAEVVTVAVTKMQEAAGK